MVFDLPADYFFEEILCFPFAEAIAELPSFEKYVVLKARLLNSMAGELHIEANKHAVIEGNVFIDRGTVIEPFVHIIGPVYIGKNVLIRSHALIRPGTIIGDNAVVGHASEVKNAHIAAETKIASLAFVGDSILGRGARVGSGTITGNRRFDQQEIAIKNGEHTLSIGKDKFGCILGDYVRLGSNVSTAPGTVIGKHTWIYSNASVSGFISKDSIVKLRQDLEIVPKKGDTSLTQRDRDGSL